MTFEWEDITDEVLEKVVLVQHVPYSTSGFIDDPGSLTAITEGGHEYLVGFEKMSWNKTFEILNLFLGETPQEKFDGAKFTYETEKWRWTDFDRIDIFIRKDFFDKIYPEWQKQHGEKWYIQPIDVARALLNPKKELPRMVFSETQAIRDEEERQRKEREEWRAKNRLVEGEDYEWKKIDSGYACEYHLLLFKENEDGTISGSKWTIVCQKEQFDEGSFKGNAPVEAYHIIYIIKDMKIWAAYWIIPRTEK